MIIQTKAYPRAGLIGNPSDGYFGKTISFTFDAFCAKIQLYETPELAILPEQRDREVYKDIHQLVADVNQFGYYGGIRLIKATIKRFYEYCQEEDLHIHNRNFTIRYHSNIPGQVGLAGSSAIITATMRALMEFFDVTIQSERLPGIILDVETRELSISAGLQDRVAQVYQGLMYMDFEKDHMDQHGYGKYERLPADSVTNLYIAYRQDLSEGSEIFHNNIKARFEQGNEEILEAMRHWADLTYQTRNLIMDGKVAEIGPLLDANFDQRKKLYQLSEGNLKMVDTARSIGASAKFSGSGGAIVGTYKDEQMFDQLSTAMEKLSIVVIQPHIIGG
ncbi:MAG: GHMP kinase [Verrucomicrobiota bacterium]